MKYEILEFHTKNREEKKKNWQVAKKIWENASHIGIYMYSEDM